MVETYDLLEKAPKDHNSEEFLQFLRDNNNIVSEDYAWLIIENCKYHTKNRPWYTAFAKVDTVLLALSEMNGLSYEFPDMHIILKPDTHRSVDRFHVHLTKLKKCV